MLKRFSRRAMRSFAVACLTLAIGLSVGAEFANAAFFSQTQTYSITSTYYSQVCVYNYNTGAFISPCYPTTFGNYSLSYQLPFGAWYAHFLYDYAQARWVEQVTVRDFQL
jgi:hypothetical protein